MKRKRTWKDNKYDNLCSRCSAAPEQHPTLYELGITGHLAELLEINDEMSYLSLRRGGDLTLIAGIGKAYATEINQKLDAWDEYISEQMRG